MWIFPLAAAVIALVFAAIVGWRFARLRRPYLAAWAVALLMFAAASSAAFLGIRNGWNSGEYRIYWLLGAVLNVPFLALGELLLLLRDRRVRAVLLFVALFGTAFALNVVRTADVHGSAFACHDLPLGKDVFASEGPVPEETAKLCSSGEPPGLAYRLAQYVGGGGGARRGARVLDRARPRDRGDVLGIPQGVVGAAGRPVVRSGTCLKGE